MEKDGTHFGKLIEEIVRKNGSDVESEAIRWGYSPNALYKIFKKEDVGTDILKKVSILYNVSLPTLLSSGRIYPSNNPQKALVYEHLVPYDSFNDNRVKELDAKIESLEAQNALLKKMVDLLEKSR